jgi:predicted phosphate transport protein (TIGR00153 family)
MVWFMPKEEDFFELFERAAANAHEGAVQLLEFVEKFDNIVERAKRIKDIEHACDQITHDVIDRLNSTFITPMDRQDIHELACRLDDIIDLIDTAVNRMVVYKIDKPTPEARELARCLKHATLLISEAMPLLRNMKNGKAINEKCIAIQTQENEADRVMQGALASLFDRHRDPIEIIKWKDIYEEIESATDRCEDVANVLDSIVLKNA